MISIIIPLFNQADKIIKCLESIKNQTLDSYEIVVVDDGSIDDTSKAREWSKEEFGYKLEWLSNDKNQGPQFTRNRGFRSAKGEFLLFCDADIVFVPKALEIMMKTLKDNPQASYAYPSHMHGIKLFRLWTFDEQRIKEMPCIHSTALIRREHFPETGWDENIKRLQDWDLWLTMLEAGHRGVWIDQVLFTIKGGGHTMSSWLPGFAYKLFPFLPKVRKYKEAVRKIKEKHGLKLGN